jgi:hypothetical protein
VVRQRAGRGERDGERAVGSQSQPDSEERCSHRSHATLAQEAPRFEDSHREQRHEVECFLSNRGERDRQRKGDEGVIGGEDIRSVLDVSSFLDEFSD